MTGTTTRVAAYATALPDALLQASRTRFGDAVTLGLGPAIETDARRDDSSPFWGGALHGIKRNLASPAEFICSAGFSYRSAAGASQMLTAGHCMAVNSPRPLTATNFVPNCGFELGTRGVSSYRDGDGSIAVNGQQVGDISALNISNPLVNSSEARIFVGGVNSSTGMIVRGVNNTTISGGQYNGSGQTTGETTGWTVESSASSYTDSGTGDVVAPVVRGGRQGACTRGGDSGGPTYTVSNGVAFALGIHSGSGGGGSDQFGGALDPCLEFYSQVQNAQNAFGGKVLTSP